MLIFNFIPKAFCILGHNLEVNRGSLSDTIKTSTQCNRITSFTYIQASFFTKYFIHIGRNKEDLINLSIIAHMTSFPFLFLGNPNTKFMEICSHFHLEWEEAVIPQHDFNALLSLVDKLDI